MSVLIAEDEPRVRSFLARGLSEEGFSVEETDDGSRALSVLGARHFDLLLLDWMLPGASGADVLSAMRVGGDMTPVIVLTAGDSVEARLNALNGGADDYVPKPFSFAELLARMRAVLRRASLQRREVLTYGDLTMDLLNRKVARAGRPLLLTAREFALLQYLLEHPGEPQSRAAIVENVWEHDFEIFSNVVDVYVRHLRQKIDAPFDVALIHTVRGLGYVLGEAIGPP